MTGEELAARRKAAGLTEQDLAGLLRRHVDEVRDLEASRRPLPRGLVRELDWLLVLLGLSDISKDPIRSLPPA